MWIGTLSPSPPSLSHACCVPFLRLTEVTCLMLWTGRLYMTALTRLPFSLFLPACMPAGRICGANFSQSASPPHMHNLGSLSPLCSVVENPPLGMSNSNSFFGSLFKYSLSQECQPRSPLPRPHPQIMF